MNIKAIPELNKIQENGGGLRIGPLGTIRELETSALVRERLPLLWESCHQFASLQIRNTATIGGNICRASPSGETLAPLLALDARARFAFSDGEKTEAFSSFFHGPGKTSLGSKGILTEIEVPYPADGSRGVYLKHAVRGAMDIAMVGVVVSRHARRRKEYIRTRGSAWAPSRRRRSRGEDQALLRGKPLTASLLKEAAALAARNRADQRPRAARSTADGSSRRSSAGSRTMLEAATGKRWRDEVSQFISTSRQTAAQREPSTSLLGFCATRCITKAPALLQHRRVRRVHGSFNGNRSTPGPARRRRRGRRNRSVEGLAQGDNSIRCSRRSSTPRGAVRLLHAGIIVSVKALLDRVKNPTPEQIEEAVSGISVAARLRQNRRHDPARGAETLRRENHGKSEYTVVGKSPRAGRRRARHRRGIYGIDLSPKDTLHGGILRRRYAHARIVSIDTSEAKQIPGVHSVITAEDAPDVRFGRSYLDRYILARNKVRYMGDPVAAVAADSPAVVKQALNKIKVVYEPLPVVIDPEEAMKPTRRLCTRTCRCRKTCRRNQGEKRWASPVRVGDAEAMLKPPWSRRSYETKMIHRKSDRAAPRPGETNAATHPLGNAKRPCRAPRGSKVLASR